MAKSATDVVQDVMVSAVLDALGAFKVASGGVANVMLRDLQAVHPNTTFADLPTAVQAAITASVRTAFTRLLKEGYAVTPSSGLPPPPPRPPIDRTRRPAPRGPGKPPVVEVRRPPRGGKPGPKR